MRRLSSIRIVLVAAAAVVALAGTSNYFALRKTTRALTDRLESFGTAQRNPGAARDVRTETDRLRAGLKTARVLLAEELDRRWLAQLSPAAQEEALALGEAKLEMARDLALQALHDRPSSWQGLMILGGSRYLLASRRNTPGRWTDRDTWEQPLLTAIERAPFQPEPKRVLAAAYLSEWSIASEVERQAALAVIRGAFGDLNTLDQLLPAWLAKASSFEQALSVIPPDPRAWRQLDHYYRQREDWQRLAEILERWDDSMPGYLNRLLQRARRMIDGGDNVSARSVLLTAITQTPIRREYAGIFGEAIELLPPGPVSSRQVSGLRGWIEWAAEGCIIADCPFPETVTKRLSALARGRVPSRQALDALLRGKLEAGIAIEERSMTVATREWASYLLLKSRLLANR